MNIAREQVAVSKYNSIKIAIWLYFLLWIFEGALRKWILPGFATPLLVVRDPIAIYIIIRAIYLNVNFINGYTILAIIFTLLGLAVTLTFGHSNLFVGIYGARIMMLHFPLIFIIGAVFTKEDVLMMGRFLLVANILMTLIIYFQYTSPQSAYINVGVGGEGSSGFNAGAMGYFRPSGTFTFVSGLSLFFTAVSVFIFHFWLSKDYCDKILLYTSTISLVIALPLTISRGAVVAVIIVGFFAVIAAGTTLKSLFKLLFVFIALYVIIVLLQNFTTIFSLSTEVFMSRVDNANTTEGGLKDSIFLRALNDFIGPIVEIFNQPMFAGNLGMGTNAGSQLLTGKSTFLISENEFGRLAGEQGIIIGGGLILLRIFLGISIAVQSLKLPKEQKLLPFIICGAACIAIFQGQWAFPSVLGYAIIQTGFVMACFDKKEDLAS